MVKINYLIATLGNFDKTKNIFNSLRAQINKNFSLVIIHQGTKSFDLSLVSNLNYIYLRTNRFGLSYARNLGLPKCRAKYISILDDDATLDPSYTDNVLNILETTLADGLCGLIVDPINKKPLSRAAINNSSFKMTNKHYSYFMSSAVTMKKKVFFSNRFDEDFGIGGLYGASEETDFFWRIVNKFTIIYDPKIIVYHPSDSYKISNMTIKNTFNRGFNYGKGRGAVIKKHSSESLWFLYVFIKSITLLFLVLFYDLFSLNLKFFVRDFGSLLGRISGFIAYK